MNLSANCRMRGSSALVIWPKVGVPKVRPSPDAPACKLGNEIPGCMLLVTLKASARTSNLPRSPTLNSRENAVSNVQNLGPGMLLRPIGLSEPNAGEAKPAGLIQQLGAGPGLAHNVFCDTWTG